MDKKLTVRDVADWNIEGSNLILNVVRVGFVIEKDALVDSNGKFLCEKVVLRAIGYLVDNACVLICYQSFWTLGNARVVV